MFVQISPSDKDLSETLSSLNFATRVRGVELGPARKQVDTNELQKMKTMLEKARLECKSKDESLKRLEENLHNLESKAKGKDQFYKTQLEKLKELEGQVELKSSLQCQSEKQVSHLSEKLKGKEESCSRLQQKVVELENKLKEKDENHSTTYQIKVNDLEKKLREQMQQSESNSQTLEHKVKELERKLTERDENAECLSLRQTIKELEDKLREQEQQPVREEMTNETEHRILRSLSLANRRGSHGSAMTKENDNLHEVRRKRLSRNSEVGVPPPVSDHHAKENDNLHEVRRKRLSRNSEVENNGAVPPPVSDHRGYKSRRSDPPKPAAAGVSRVTRPSIAVQRPVARVKTTRDAAVQGIKEKDSKKRMWTR